MRRKLKDEVDGEDEANANQIGGADTSYQKKVEEGMRRWIEVIECM